MEANTADGKLADFPQYFATVFKNTTRKFLEFHSEKFIFVLLILASFSDADLRGFQGFGERQRQVEVGMRRRGENTGEVHHDECFLEFYWF
jgi:hypothetical protein